MTSDTPVIISEQTDIYVKCSFCKMTVPRIWSATTRSLLCLNIECPVVTSEVFVQLDAAKVHTEKAYYFLALLHNSML